MLNIINESCPTKIFLANNLLSGEGIKLKKGALSSNKALDRVLAVPLSPILAVEARVLVAQVRPAHRQHL